MLMQTHFVHFLGLRAEHEAFYLLNNAGLDLIDVSRLKVSNNSGRGSSDMNNNNNNDSGRHNDNSSSSSGGGGGKNNNSADRTISEDAQSSVPSQSADQSVGQSGWLA